MLHAGCKDYSYNYKDPEWKLDFMDWGQGTTPHRDIYTLELMVLGPYSHFYWDWT